MNYILTHWRGQQGLLRSILLNGLLVYLVLVTVMVYLGIAISPSRGIYVGLSVFMIWWVWASVGIFRCGIRNVLDRNSRVIAKIGGVLAMGGVVALTYSTVDDLRHMGFFRWLK